MTGVPVSPRRVYGVALAFTAEAGSATWVCRATPGPDGIRVEAVETLAAMPGGAVPREAAYRVLVAKMLEVPRSAWGVAGPFSAPPSGECEPPVPTSASAHWLNLLELAAGTEGVEQFVQRASAVAELTDAVRAEQLYRVARGILSPARRQGGVAVLPFDPVPLLPPGTPAAMLARAPSIYLLEVAPGRLLAALEAEGRIVGGHAGADERGREGLLRALTAAGQIRPLARRLRVEVAGAGGGGAFDAVLAAIAAWRGYATQDHGRLHVDPAAGHAGWVY